MNNFRYRFTEWLSRFMQGRYCRPDELYRFLNILILVLMVIHLFLRTPVLYFLIMLLIIFNTWRVFSHNIERCYRQNQFFIQKSKPLKDWLSLKIRQFKDRNQYRYRKCPKCGKTLRLPLKKGRHTVECPNCHHEFEVKI